MFDERTTRTGSPLTSPSAFRDEVMRAKALGDERAAADAVLRVVQELLDNVSTSQHPILAVDQREGRPRPVVEIAGADIVESVFQGEAFLDGLNLKPGAVPAAADSPGITGTIRADADHVYVCVAPNTWKRASLSTWA